MIKYKQFVFAAPPRTATTWFMKAAQDLGLGDGSKSHVHDPAPRDWNGLVVSMVRHPYDWLYSYYYALQGGAIGVDAVDGPFVYIARESTSVDRFIRLYLKRKAGAVGEMFNTYNASTVLRVEDLPYGAGEFFESLGVPSWSATMMLPAQNTYNGVTDAPNKKQRKAVVAAERALCQQYEYF